MHLNNYVFISFDDISQFDWDVFTNELTEFAIDKYPLLFTLKRSHFFVDTETLLNYSYVTIVFEFNLNDNLYYFSYKVDNPLNLKFIILEKPAILNHMVRNVNKVIKEYIRECNASK